MYNGGFLHMDVDVFGDYQGNTNLTKILISPEHDVSGWIIYATRKLVYIVVCETVYYRSDTFNS